MAVADGSPPAAVETPVEKPAEKFSAGKSVENQTLLVIKIPKPAQTPAATRLTDHKLMRVAVEGPIGPPPAGNPAGEVIPRPNGMN